MLIMKRKFDIRVWVTVPTWNPLKIYIYRECYLRFSGTDYDPRCHKNLFSHLTNNSIGKKSSQKGNQKIPGNMWSLDEFKEYLGKQNAMEEDEEDEIIKEGNRLWDTEWYPQVKEIIV